MRIVWSEEQEALLKKVWRGKGNLKRSLDLFEGRSYDAVVCHAHKMKLGRRPHPDKGVAAFAWDAILNEIKKGPGTVEDITRRVRLSHSAVGKYLKPRFAGPDGEFHIVDWNRRPQGGGAIPVYAFGPGENAPKPQAMNNAQIAAHRREQRRQERVAAGLRPRFTNPFAAAAGLVSAPAGKTGRVYAQPMGLRDFDEELAA